MFADEAKRILEGLNKAKSQVAAETLEERILMCEHAAALANGHLVMQCKFSDLKAHLFRTEGLWEWYPFSSSGPRLYAVCQGEHEGSL